MSPDWDRVTRSKTNAGECKGKPRGGRLLLVRDRGLDGLHATDELDSVLRLEELVKRTGLEIGGRQARHERLPDMERLDGHGLAIRQPEACCDEHGLGWGHMEHAAQPRAGGDRS